MKAKKKTKRATAAPDTSCVLTIKPRVIIVAPIVNRDPRQLLTR
jgi:hypothetical protein